MSPFTEAWVEVVLLSNKAEPTGRSQRLGGGVAEATLLPVFVSLMASGLEGSEGPCYLHFSAGSLCLRGARHLLAWAGKSKEARMPNCVFQFQEQLMRETPSTAGVTHYHFDASWKGPLACLVHIL